jgi:hypothetical protein
MSKPPIRVAWAFTPRVNVSRSTLLPQRPEGRGESFGFIDYPTPKGAGY